jgi:uncharacterized protein (TIGR03435 family)
MMSVSSLTGVVAAIGPELANHLWQSTAFAVVAAGLAVALKKNQARARYWIWMLASVKLLLPFTLLAGIASHWVRPRSATARPAHTGMVVALEDVSEPFSFPVRQAPHAERIVATGSADPTLEDATEFRGAPTSAVAIRVSGARHGRSAFFARVVPVLPLGCGIVWLAGFVTVLILWCVRWRRVAKAIREAAPIHAGRELEVLRRTELAAGSGTRIEMRESDSAMEPGVFGILRPVLAWPARISERLDDAQLEAVLTHEVCHLRRRDNLTAALHMFVEAVFWFHPMVWWISARLVEERERACDEKVLELCTEPQVYAESILKVCAFCVQSPLECVAGVTGADLKKRVVEILKGRVALKLTWGKRLLLVATALLVAAVPIVLGQAKAAQRMMVAAEAKSAPRPIRAIAHAMIAVAETPATGEIAELKVDEQPGLPMPVATEPEASAQPAAAPSDSEPFFDPNLDPEEQALAKTVVFDVASFRVNLDSRTPKTFDIPADGDGFTMINRPMRDIIRFAFNVTSGVNFHFANQPAWIDQVMWDVRAKVAPENLATWQKLSARGKRFALRRFAVDNLKLTFHKDMTPYTYYNLTVDKRGPKMALAKEGDSFTSPRGLKIPAPSVMWTGPGEIAGHHGTMEQLSVVLSGHTPWVVHDETGLTDAYNFAISYSPGSVDDPRGGGRTLPVGYFEADGPSLFTAVQQIGLKLVATKGPLEGMVVDHVERPPEN